MEFVIFYIYILYINNFYKVFKVKVLCNIFWLLFDFKCCVLVLVD